MKKIFLVAFLIFVFFISSNKVSAEQVTVTTDFFDNVYSNRKKDGITYWGRFAYIKVDGQIAYCLDPANIINTSVYQKSENFGELNLSYLDIRKIENYAYYGYGYEGHTAKEYYMATQQLIWELFPEFTTYYTTRSNQQGDIIDVSSYMQEIKDTIAKYSNPPKIPGYISGKVGQSIMINDENNVLNEYVLEKESPNVSLNGNQLIVNFTEPMVERVIIKRKLRGNYRSFLCLADNNQTVSVLGLNHQDNYYFDVETLPMKKAVLRIYKTDSSTKKLIEDRVKFRIKDLNSNKYFTYNANDIFETDNGILELPFELEEGNYSIEEIEAPYGYYLNDESYDFSIEEDTELIDEKYLDIYFMNKPILCNLIINKINKDTKEPLKGAKFEIYNSSNELIDTITTDDSGKAVLNNLRYGTYYVKEIEAPVGYIIDDAIKTIEINKEETIIDFYNQKIKAPDTNINKNSFPGVIGIFIVAIGVFLIKNIKKSL